MEIRNRIEELSGDLTTTERKLCAALLSDYPFAGLEPIQAFAEMAKTSPPTVSRFVTKLGFQGYQEFQRQLIGELKEGQRSPVDLQKTSTPVEGAFLASFMIRANALLSETSATVSDAQFDRICGLLSDEKRSIYVIGGRMSDALGLYLSRHLRQIRAKVYHLPSDPEVWPEYLLRMRPKDVLFVVDFRRYQQNLNMLAEKAAQARSAQIVLMTDKWLSPISKHASEILAVPVDSSTPWDSYTGAMALLEALVTRIADRNWTKTKSRIEAWDSMRPNFEGPGDDL